MATALETMQLAHAGKGCLGKAKADEPVFVLRAHDKLAPIIVRQWAKLLKFDGSTSPKIEDAFKLADEMIDWANRNGGSKLPD